MKYLKKLLLILGLILIFVPNAIGTEFWASKQSVKNDKHVFHIPSCKRAQMIAPEDLVKFSSPDEATKAGYVPCNVCKPQTVKK